MWHFTFDQTFKILSLLGAIVSFVWGVLVWRGKSREVAKTRRIEATKPFLELQLKLYTEASKIAAVVATSNDATARNRFWELYWGELALVEDRQVEAAMRAMGDVLRSPSDNGVEKELSLAKLSLKLAHAFRGSLDRSWGINIWTTGSTQEHKS